jgi:pimeloyl-ACP methyl ester carboxylesterase
VIIEAQRASVTDGEIAYLDVGEGPAVVLLHGFPLSSVQWRDLTPLLAARFRVIAPDLLGSGTSDKPAAVPLGASAQAGRVRELLTNLDIDRFAIVAHGTGGVIEKLLALDGDGVEAMVLLDIADSWRSPRERDYRDPREGIASILDGGMRQRDRFGESLIDAYGEPFAEDPDAFARLSQDLRGDASIDRSAELARIEFPVLILWGEDDPVAPVADAEALNEAMPSSTLALLPGCGHFLPDEAPDTIGPIIFEYLRAMYLRAPHGHDGQKEGVVMLQLERRPPWVDLEDEERDEWFDVDEPAPAASEEPIR